MNAIRFLLIYFIIVGVNLNINSYYVYFFVLLLFFFNNEKKISLNYRNSICIPIILLVVFSLIKVWQISTRTLMDCGLLVLGTICYWNNKRFFVDVKLLNQLIWAGLLLCLIVNGGTIHLGMTDFLTSDIGYESAMFAYTLPFFMYYWLKRGNKRYVIINIICILLAGKRIALLAILVGLGYYYCDKRFNIKKIKSLIIAANVIYLFFTFSLAAGYFDEFIQDSTGFTVNQLTMGRFELYNSVIENVDIFKHHTWLYGIGLGNSNIVIEETLEEAGILHNDLLKIFIECGLVIFMLFFFLLYDIRKKWQWGYIIIWNVILLTDNTLIYVPVIFTLCLMLDSEFIAINMNENIVNPNGVISCQMDSKNDKATIER